MNQQQKFWLDQVISDWEVYLLLKEKEVHPCHVLHYLQMTTEKLGKAFFWKDGNPPKPIHAIFTRYLKVIAEHKSSKVLQVLELSNVASLGSFIRGSLPVAFEIEKLAPAISGFDQPNVEYPWPHDYPKYSPAKYDFHAWDLIHTAHGRQLLHKLPKLINNLHLYS